MISNSINMENSIIEELINKSGLKKEIEFGYSFIYRSIGLINSKRINPNRINNTKCKITLVFKFLCQVENNIFLISLTEFNNLKCLIFVNDLNDDNYNFFINNFIEYNSLYLLKNGGIYITNYPISIVFFLYKTSKIRKLINFRSFPNNFDKEVYNGISHLGSSLYNKNISLFSLKNSPWIIQNFLINNYSTLPLDIKGYVFKRKILEDKKCIIINLLNSCNMIDKWTIYVNCNNNNFENAQLKLLDNAFINVKNLKQSLTQNLKIIFKIDFNLKNFLFINYEKNYKIFDIRNRIKKNIKNTKFNQISLISLNPLIVHRSISCIFVEVLKLYQIELKAECTNCFNKINYCSCAEHIRRIILKGFATVKCVHFGISINCFIRNPDEIKNFFELNGNELNFLDNFLKIKGSFNYDLGNKYSYQSDYAKIVNMFSKLTDKKLVYGRFFCKPTKNLNESESIIPETMKKTPKLLFPNGTIKLIKNENGVLIQKLLYCFKVFYSNIPSLLCKYYNYADQLLMN